MEEFWNNKRVLITGDTGFKGSWLTCILLNLGAKVYGISLEADEENKLHNSLKNDEYFKTKIYEDLYSHYDLDIRNESELKSLILKIHPEIVFHLAAQPLVRESYINPKSTWETNVLGTINVLEAIRGFNSCSVVVVTTDKVYENDNRSYGYVESDQLGGLDPYSSSKASCELAVSSWRRSFFHENVKISTARAGNVIGGGDWAKDRIVPDVIKSLTKDTFLEVRYPNATRPWQHVLEPLFGYLKLAEKQLKSDTDFAYNFGPELKDVISVKEIVHKIEKFWGGKVKLKFIENQPKESSKLILNVEKTKKELSWRPIWNIDQTIEITTKWYYDVYHGKSPYKCISNNVNSYVKFL